MKSRDLYVQLSRSQETLQRYSRMEEMLRSKTSTERVDMENLFQLLKDHKNYPDSICRHPREEIAPDGRMRTIAAVFSREREEGIWVGHGNPCMGELRFYGLGS